MSVNKKHFGNKNIEELSMPMKTVPEALNLRSLFLENFEAGFEIYASKGPDHLAPSLGHPGRFLGSTYRDRQLKFSEFAWFRVL